jgi:hypothetical protein
MGLATFWAIFSKTDLVTLVVMYMKMTEAARIFGPLCPTVKFMQ